MTYSLTRITALEQAVKLHAWREEECNCHTSAHVVLCTAELFHAWLGGPVSLRLVQGPVVNQATGLPTSTPQPEGDVMAQIHDDEKYSLSVVTKDAKGFQTADAITWAIDDPSVAALEVAEDGQSAEVVAVAPGSTAGSVSDTSVEPPLSASFVVDVLPGGTVKIDLVEGPAEKQ